MLSLLYHHFGRIPSIPHRFAKWFIFLLYCEQQNYQKLILSMIQRLLEIQKQKLKKEEKAGQNPLQTKAKYLSLHLNSLNMISQENPLTERSDSDYQGCIRRVPITDRANFNRKLVFIKTRKKKDTTYMSNFKTSHQKTQIQKSKAICSQQNFLMTKNYFCARLPLKTDRKYKKTSLHEKTLEQIIPFCSKIHRIGYKQQEILPQNTMETHFRKAKSFTAQSFCKKNSKQFLSTQKLKILNITEKSPQGSISDSLEISPWKYGHSRHRQNF